ncbi:hypothetical protein GGR52DRAFT_488598 [Hypoxylon sp. FL1284]|nr:hypothetical protein GGR52DRAFT_488598 [Hypoxylon sp. FL1284]
MVPQEALVQQEVPVQDEPVQEAPAQKKLDSLPARPPTPPRDKKQDSDPSSKRILSNHPVDTRLNNLHTPPSYSPSSADTANASSRGLRKKVGFLAQAEYRDPPTYANKENVRIQSTPNSIPSSTASAKPVRSILKQSSSPLPHNPLASLVAGDEVTGQINITAMLETTVTQLAGGDRESKIDAYVMLARALKTSNNLPDRIALQAKMSLLTQFIHRDVTTKGVDGSVDTSMVNHALGLLCTFCHFPAIASTLSSDFAVSIIEHCIHSFDDPAVSKDVVRHLMQVVVSQDFPPKVMTADRVGRLIGSLHRIEDHMKGKSIILSRILIYHKLIRQSRSHMIIYADWLGDLFTDMLSSMKEIRAAAIAFGLEASFTIGKEKQLSRKVMELLHKQIDETKYIEYYVDRLKTMTKDKDDSAAVPQVWSVVILLLRCPLERWEFFTPFLEIIQRCFNSGNYHTRLEANYAWNRLVYALHLNDESFSKTIVTICQPFHSQLKRKGSSKQLNELRRVVVASVCNLYYYVFRPNLTPAQVDSYWDLSVRPIMQRLIAPEEDSKQEASAAAASKNLTQTTMILTGLLNSSTPRLWKEDRVAEAQLIKPDELPALDPKWVRRNAVRVFGVVEPILQRTFLDLASPDSASYKLWQTLVGAVSVAASKEVKVSTDTATFMASAFGVLVRIWSRGLDESNAQPESQQKFLDATRAYVSTMVESLGLLPFTEKLLSLNKQSSFVPVATPSHRPGKGLGLTRTPLHHLFSILSTLPPGIPDDGDLYYLIKVVFDPFILSRSSSHAKTDLARELIQTMPTLDALSPYGPWLFVSEVFSLTLDSSQSSHATTSSGSEPTTVGHEYREIVKHLERGILSTPNLPWEHWSSLFQLLAVRVTSEAGEAGCAIAVVEPLAKSLADAFTLPEGELVSINLVRSSIELIATARQPRDVQALNAARRRLWGTSIAGSRSASSFDPFDSFYRLTNELLGYMYAHVDQYDQDEITVLLLTEITNFLMRCHPQLVLKTLAQLQSGVGLWIQDTDARYSSKQSSGVFEAVKTLWDRICTLFPDPDSHSTLHLAAVEDLFCSAFQSKHKYIVNAVSAVWNRSFEQVEEMQYPEKLKAVLVSIHPYVDLVLPGLDLSSYGSTGQEPSFIESQDDSEASHGPSTSLANSVSDQRTPPATRRSTRQSATPGSVQLSLSSKRGADTTPTPSLPKSSRRSTTPRPRHDDSQIQFAPVESSSPGPDATESQHLTDRQKEVRERQRENAVLFPQIRASAEGDQSTRPDSGHSEQREHLPAERAATPPPAHDMEDYVASTPTPRRGQAPILDYDHEMTDEIPSSPPEPRPFSVAHMQTRSRSSSMLQQFPMSSSPISGSPAPKRRAAVNQTMVEHEETEEIGDDVVEAMQEEEPKDMMDKEMEVSKPETASRDEVPAKKSVVPKNITPRITRSRKAAVSSPRSDPEEFVDALTSPAPQTPRNLRSRNVPKAPQTESSVPQASQAKDRSFELSDGEERSMARLVIELDSRKCDPVPRYDSSSPEKSREAGKADEAVSECIMVNTSSRNLRRRSRKGEDNQSAPASPVDSPSPADVEYSESELVSSKKSKKKRKRHTEKSQEPGSGRKKRRQGKNTGVETVPSSQLSQDTEADAEVDVAMEGSELDAGTSSDKAQDVAEQEPEPTVAEASQRDSSPVSFNDNSFDDSLAERESDTEAVTLQIITEASQQSDMGAITSELHHDEATLLVDEDVEMADEPKKSGDDMEEKAEAAVEQSQSRLIEEPQVEAEVEAEAEPQTTPEAEVGKSAAEAIMGALQSGLSGLRMATLTREEVNRIEDLFFDIKKELYQAESRSRR